MDHSFSPIETAVRPWRTATVVAAGVAAVELVLLVVVGGALIARPVSGGSSGPEKRAQSAARTSSGGAKAAAAPTAASTAAQLPRGKVSVLVLNGNGVTGAAAASAQRVLGRGYKISAVTNAPRSDYTRSLVMYRRGFAGEAARLAHDLGIKIIGPLDGLRSSQLHGANVVLVVGA